MRVSRTGEPAYFPEIPDELLVAAAVDEEHLALIRSIGMRSALVVPLAVRGRKLGALTLVQAESGRRFDHADLAFAEQLAATAAVALDNARLYEEQWRTAQTLQAALLPADLPDVPGLRLAARYRAPTDDGPTLHVGGDLYDVVPARRTAAGVVVADVCGKGAAGRGAHRADPAHRARRDRPRARARRGAGAAQPGDAPRERRRPGRFATVAQARLTRRRPAPTVRLASAGHPPPLVRPRRPGRSPWRRRAPCSASTRTSA